MCQPQSTAYNHFMTPEGSFPSARSDAFRADRQRSEMLANEQAGLSRDNRDDLAAALHARRELGPEYDAAFAESLAERIDQTIEARLHGSARSRTDIEHVYLLKIQQENARGERKVSTAIACVSLGVSIPLSGIAAGLQSLPFLVIVWTGIVMINMAYALRRRG
jgi:hypothetical protein